MDIAETTIASWTAKNLQRRSKVPLTNEVQLATNHIDDNNGYKYDKYQKIDWPSYYLL